MSQAIENYALIGDRQTGALVGTNGSIDWMCMPRFDSASVFGGLLGDDDHGHWRINPVGMFHSTSREYREDSFVLATRWVTETGEVEVLDFMPTNMSRATVIRRIRGVSGEVAMEQMLRIRFDYARSMPWMRQVGDENNALLAVAGPDSVVVQGPKFEASHHHHRAEFTVQAGEIVDTVLTWYPSHRKPPAEMDVEAALAETLNYWQTWSRGIKAPGGKYHQLVRRSLQVLNALTHAETGGIIAALTTSLPEQLGGSRNWDYRYVWLRDAALTLEALMIHGYQSEAREWRDWLLRAIAGDPADVQIMYGISGERRLDEYELDSLPGHWGSSPVRVGNGAFDQYQADIYGEVLVALHRAREIGVTEDEFSWSLQSALLSHLEANWAKPDNGIWEIRGPQRIFTHSRVMAWAAFDRGIRGIEEFGMTGPLDRWKRIRARISEEIEEQGYNKALGCYTQAYGSPEVDSALLQLPQVGYIAYDDPRMLGTVARIEADLMVGGVLQRYRTESGIDGITEPENAFLACSFWLVEQYAHSDRLKDAEDLMDLVTSFANDVGLLSEEYDVTTHQQTGNTPQAFSHLTLVRAADALATAKSVG
jgi:GH15 family glucan-1,4-alpha-glucosidase